MKMLNYFFLLFFSFSCSQLLLSQERVASKQFELSPRVEKIVEHYQDDAVIEALIKKAEPFNDPDFIHRVCHRYEAAAAWVYALNKKVVYKLPECFSLDGHRIALCGSDLIRYSSHLFGNILEKQVCKKLIDQTASALAATALRNRDQLQGGKPQAVETLIIEEFWNSQEARQLCMAYLYHRLPFVLLAYTQKQLTPPPFFMHGKSSAARLADCESFTTVPISSVLDPILLDQAFGTIQKKDYKHQELMQIKTYAAYLLEGAKQFELIGTIDHGFLFAFAKEMAIACLLFHQDFKKLVISALSQRLNLQELCSALTSTEAEKDVTKLFSAVLKGGNSKIVASLRFARDRYEVTVTYLLLSPIIFNLLRYSWNFLSALNKPVNEVTQS